MHIIGVLEVVLILGMARQMALREKAIMVWDYMVLLITLEQVVEVEDIQRQAPVLELEVVVVPIFLMVNKVILEFTARNMDILQHLAKKE